MGCFASKNVYEVPQQQQQFSNESPFIVPAKASSPLAGERTNNYVLGNTPGAVDPAVEAVKQGLVSAKSGGSFSGSPLPNVAVLHLSHTARRTPPAHVSADLNAIVDEQGTINSLVSRQLSMMSHYSVKSEAGSVILQPENGPNALGFTLQKLIGRGGFGNVYLGEWEGQRVAVKVVTGSTEQSDQPEDKEWEARKEKMAQMEAILMASVNHPNIVNTLKVIAHQGDAMDPEVVAIEKTLFEKEKGGDGHPPSFEWHIIMEYCDRGSLSRALANHRFHEPAESGFVRWDAWSCLETLKEVVHALTFLHENRILHGDLKAANVLLLSSDQDKRGFIAKVSDFGLSRVLAGNRTQIKTQTFGTVTHMPPELLSKGILTPSADVYAMGVLMWEVYSADRVFKHLSDSEVILAVVTRKARPTFPPDVPPRFKYVAERCWAEIPEVRPSLTQLHTELENLQKMLCPQGPDSARMTVQACVKQRKPTTPLVLQPKPLQLPSSRLGQSAASLDGKQPVSPLSQTQQSQQQAASAQALKANVSTPGREFGQNYVASPLQPAGQGQKAAAVQRPPGPRASAGKSSLGRSAEAAAANAVSTAKAHVVMQKAPSMQRRREDLSVTASAASSPAMTRPPLAGGNARSSENGFGGGSGGPASGGGGGLTSMMAPRGPATIVGTASKPHTPSRLRCEDSSTNGSMLANMTLQQQQAS